MRAPADFRRRIAEDLTRSRDQLASRLGKKPRAIAWPFGRYNGTDIEVAKACGFDLCAHSGSRTRGCGEANGARSLSADKRSQAR